MVLLRWLIVVGFSLSRVGRDVAHCECVSCASEGTEGVADLSVVEKAGRQRGGEEALEWRADCS